MGEKICLRHVENHVIYPSIRPLSVNTHSCGAISSQLVEEFECNLAQIFFVAEQVFKVKGHE